MPGSFSDLSVLVAHPWMGFGGSEATTMWAVQALLDEGAQVTLFSASAVDVEKLNRIYGTTVSRGQVRVLRSSRLPFLPSGAHLAHWQNGWFQRQCRRIAPNFDLAISGYNPIDFGRSGVQLIGDYTWSEALRRAIDPDAGRLPRHRDHWVRRMYLEMGDFLRGESTWPDLRDDDLVLANSDWTRRILDKEVGRPDCPIVFPPVCYQSTVGSVPDSARRDPLSFVCLGRISPEKRIESAIRILSRVRAIGFPVTLSIAGSADDADYGKRIADLARTEGSWISLTGFLEASARDYLLARSSFGIHTRPAEAFGIAVAEMAGSGCVPFVPDMGGPAEIVDRPELRFRDEDEAVSRIVAVLNAPDHIPALRAGLAASMERFQPGQFMRSFLNEVDGFLHRNRQTFQSHHAGGMARRATAASAKAATD